MAFLPVWCTIFLLASAFLVKDSMENFARIVSAVQEHFHAGCVFVIQEQRNGWNDTSYVKILYSKMGQNVVPVVTTTVFNLQQSFYEFEEDRPLYVIVGTGENIRHFLKKLHSTRRASTSKWLLFLQTTSVLDEFFDKINIPFDCEFLVSQPANERVVDLIEVYRVASHLPLQTYSYGNWTPSGGLRATSRSFYERRNSLQGFALKIGTINTPVLTITKGNSGEPEHLDGFFGHVWRLLEERMNFTSVYSSPEDGNIGALTGVKWTGIIGMLVNGEVDASNIDFIMDSPRFAILDFLTPVINTGTTVIIRKEDIFDVAWNDFLSPFSSGLWLVTLVAQLTLAASVPVIYYIGRHFGIEDNHRQAPYSFADAIFYTLSMFERQAQEVIPRASSMRVVFLTSHVTAMVLFAGYSSSLTSYLTLRRTVLPFNSFSELLQDGTYSLGVMSETSVYDFFRDNRNTVMKQVFNRLILSEANNLPKSHDEGINRVCTATKYAYVVPLSTACTLLSNITCVITPVPGASIPGTKAMALVKNSSFRGLFNYNLQRIQETGLMRRLRLKYIKWVVPEEDKTLPPVHIANITSLLTVLLVSLLVSVVILTVETLWYNIKRRRTKLKILKCRPARDPRGEQDKVIVTLS